MWKRFMFFAVFLCVFSLYITGNTGATEYRPIVLHDEYEHRKYAPIPDKNDIVGEFRAFTTCFDGTDDDNGDGISDILAIPNWVAYELKAYPGELESLPSSPSPWIRDEGLYLQGIAPSDDSYHFSQDWRDANPDSPQLGYDRGHMCMKRHAWRLGENATWNTHTVLNGCPQKSKLNQGIWCDLEDKTAEWADEYGSVWIMTGPIIYNHKPSKWLGQEGEVPVAIPDAFFKIIVREVGNEKKVLSFVYPQEGIEYSSGPFDHKPYLTSVDIIETLTGLDFFPQLPEVVENSLESTIHVEIWN